MKTSIIQQTYPDGWELTPGMLDRQGPPIKFARLVDLLKFLKGRDDMCVDVELHGHVGFLMQELHSLTAQEREEYRVRNLWSTKKEAVDAKGQ